MRTAVHDLGMHALRAFLKISTSCHLNYDMTSSIQKPCTSPDTMHEKKMLSIKASTQREFLRKEHVFIYVNIYIYIYIYTYICMYVYYTAWRRCVCAAHGFEVWYKHVVYKFTWFYSHGHSLPGGCPCCLTWPFARQEIQHGAYKYGKEAANARAVYRSWSFWGARRQVGSRNKDQHPQVLLLKHANWLIRKQNWLMRSGVDECELLGRHCVWRTCRKTLKREGRMVLAFICVDMHVRRAWSQGEWCWLSSVLTCMYVGHDRKENGVGFHLCWHTCTSGMIARRMVLAFICVDMHVRRAWFALRKKEC
jgi:hypothetical protein